MLSGTSTVSRFIGSSVAVLAFSILPDARSGVPTAARLLTHRLLPAVGRRAGATARFCAADIDGSTDNRKCALPLPEIRLYGFATYNTRLSQAKPAAMNALVPVSQIAASVPASLAQAELGEAIDELDQRAFRSEFISRIRRGYLRIGSGGGRRRRRYVDFGEPP
jgi:hypothetical protein